MKNLGLLLLIALVAFTSCKKKKNNPSYVGTYVGQLNISTPDGDVEASDGIIILKKGSNSHELKDLSGMIYLLDEDNSGSFTIKPDVVTDDEADTLGNFMKTVSGSGKFEGSHLTYEAELVNQADDTFYNHVTFDGKKK